MHQSKTTLLAITVVSLLGACAAPSGSKLPPPAQHLYKLTVKGKGDAPVAGAKVKFDDFIGLSAGAKPFDCVTDANGVCSTKLEAYSNSGYSYIESYTTGLDYAVSKEGYYGRKGSMKFTTGRGETAPTEAPNRDVYLYRPVDFLSDNLLNSPFETELKEQALRFLDLLRVQSLLHEADLRIGGIGTSNFKDKKYFQMKVDGTTIFNTIKLDKYAIGKQIFDDTIRKILNPLNDHISNPNSFYGYDLVVYGKSKNFADEGSSARTTEYRYLIPQDIVRRYKSQDLSGQQTLDASVILMDNDRIELRLQ